MVQFGLEIFCIPGQVFDHLAGFADNSGDDGAERAADAGQGQDEDEHDGPDAGHFFSDKKFNDRVEDVGQDERDRDGQEHGGKAVGQPTQSA